jgi:predicted DNA-binding transcriptional regulator YafY
MAARRSRAAVPVAAVTFERAARLRRLLHILGGGPRKRDLLIRQLGLGVRGFYRDLDAMRKAGIDVALEGGRYVLQGDAEEATTRLPFPDPGLTLGEARQLARGRTAAHRKLAAQVQAVEGTGPDKPRARRKQS